MTAVADRTSVLSGLPLGWHQTRPFRLDRRFPLLERDAWYGGDIFLGGLRSCLDDGSEVSFSLICG